MSLAKPQARPAARMGTSRWTASFRGPSSALSTPIVAYIAVA